MPVDRTGVAAGRKPRAATDTAGIRPGVGVTQYLQLASVLRQRSRSPSARSRWRSMTVSRPASVMMSSPKAAENRMAGQRSADQAANAASRVMVTRMVRLP